MIVKDYKNEGLSIVRYGKIFFSVYNFEDDDHFIIPTEYPYKPYA